MRLRCFVVMTVVFVLNLNLLETCDSVGDALRRCFGSFELLATLHLRQLRFAPWVNPRAARGIPIAFSFLLRCMGISATRKHRALTAL